ncbi:FAD-binding oxidoreductase [Streptomyces sp. NPDC127068]|uniref:FAD-binding oxidoreductase n=1 Tax=Streptomyces sp. NPDC127068 TaxID=3347127 RepID=UPI003651C236
MTDTRFPPFANEAWDRLVLRVTGGVLLPGDTAYARELHGFNEIARHRPSLIVLARTPDDVRAAVEFADRQGLAVGVQATGHGIAAPEVGGVLVSTRRMSGVSVDPVTRTARVAAGARWQQVIAAAGVHGLAPLNGSSPSVGVVGYTLGGGLGPLGRRYGYAADHVTRIELVTADGVLRTASATRHPDLFWALRGGKGNFGIVTALDFALMPVRRIYGGGLHFPGELAPEALHVWREWVRRVPEEMTSSLALLRLPAAPAVPELFRGKAVVHLRICHAGDPRVGERLVRPLRAIGPALSDSVRDRPYTEVAEIHQDPTEPLPYHERNLVLRDLDRAAVEEILALAGPGADCADLMVELRQLGGALSRPAAVPNAVGNRDGEFTLSTLSPPGSPDRVLAGMAARGTGGRYLNFLAGPDTVDAVQDCFDAPTLARLRRVKASYDPRNLFRLGHALPPAN